MGLFGLGKKKDDEKKFSSMQFQQNMANLPEFPSLEDDEVSEFPKYEPTVADIKQEVGRNDSEDDFELPVRNKDFSNKKMATVSDNTPEQSFSRNISSDNKPLFVRIDNYKEAMHLLENLKSKLSDAEEVFKAIEEIKAQENDKLESWKKDLQSMKDKLFSIDKSLFEV